MELFERQGYAETTIADIGTRTFFSYFASKDEILFPDADARMDGALRAIAQRRPDDRPVDVPSGPRWG